MNYFMDFSKEFKTKLEKIKRKNNLLSQRIKKKISEIRKNPLHYKPLKNKLKGFRRVHVNYFVILFEIQEDVIIFREIEHHDDAY